MASIYIHIPFCQRKCSYCNFFSTTNFSLKSDFLLALKKEIQLRSKEIGNQTISSVYFGGGTPSLLNPTEIQDIISNLLEIFSISENAEITMEANPNCLSEEYVRALKNTQINRLSIGIQSFSEQELKILNRTHTAEQAKKSIAFAQKHGFENLSIDLIYGLPSSSIKTWAKNLDEVKEIAHLSCYQLTLEPDSVLYQQIENKQLSLPSEEETMKQYDYLTDFSAKHNFTHYEISNFCKTNRYSLHNCSYWNNTPYLGLGPGAHSFDLLQRRWNFSDVEKYVSTLLMPDFLQEYPKSLFQAEKLSTDMSYNEYIMTSLRTIWGCDLTHIHAAFGEKYISFLKKNLKNLNSDFYVVENNKIKLTNKGFLFADNIASCLFVL